MKETTTAYQKGFYAGYAKGRKEAEDELNKLKETNKKLLRGIDKSWTGHTESSVPKCKEKIKSIMDM